MIILLQSVTAHFRKFFDIFRISECKKAILSQIVTVCCYKVHQVLQILTGCYYKVRQVLQSAAIIKKCDVTRRKMIFVIEN